MIWKVCANASIIIPSAAEATSLLKRPADRDDCADMVVTLCHAETMTGQTIVIDSGRYFH
jgi:3-oxoacyl-[acyl-carrier protein] reductase